MNSDFKKVVIDNIITIEIFVITVEDFDLRNNFKEEWGKLNKAL